MTGNAVRGNVILQTTERISFIVWQDDKGRTLISRSDRPLEPLNDIIVMPHHPVLIEMSGVGMGSTIVTRLEEKQMTDTRSYLETVADAK